jgi:hypothetical protein
LGLFTIQTDLDPCTTTKFVLRKIKVKQHETSRDVL